MPSSSDMTDPTAYVLLEDGTRFDGQACGATGSSPGEGHAVGEVVFTTGMSGYQESMTDPSFAGQLIAYTYPHIGNYGVSGAAMESGHAWARAAIMREACNREDAPTAERGWLDWLEDWGGDRVRGGVPRADARGARTRADRRRAVDGRAGPRAGGHTRTCQPTWRGRRRAAHLGDRLRHQGVHGARARRAGRARHTAPLPHQRR